MIRLYGYFRSSAAYRVRIALNLKGLPWEPVPVNLVENEQRSEPYLARNPQGLVPTIELDDGTCLPQSTAILEYLEELYPTPALLPSHPVARARARGLAAAITHDVHPLNNLRVLKYLGQELGLEQAAREDWYRHWVRCGFDALEPQLGEPFAMGDRPGLVDVCLVPQVYNARRFELDLSPYPRVAAIEAACLALPAFADARPEAQADCPEHLRD